MASLLPALSPSCLLGNGQVGVLSRGGSSEPQLSSWAWGAAEGDWGAEEGAPAESHQARGAEEGVPTEPGASEPSSHFPKTATEGFPKPQKCEAGGSAAPSGPGAPCLHLEPTAA